MTDRTQPTSYDETPYPSHAYQSTHIRHLETMGTLFGMSPTPVAQCRVLELGCASGMNLVPQAIDFPNSEFIGIDLSKRQIADGVRLTKDLRTPNVDLRHADIMEVDASWGEFDYILCHGILSWVPNEVQRKVFEVFQTNLSPQGVAIVSYNTYPGWHSVEIVRNAMAFHASHFSAPKERVDHGIAFARFMAEYGPQDSPITQIFKQECDGALKQHESYIAHEFLETCNRPFYFTEIAALGRDFGLQYLCEPVFARMLLENYPVPNDIGQMIRAMPLLKQEQYIDFLSYRRFRSTMFCHQEVALDRSVASEDLMRFHLAFGAPGTKNLDNADPTDEKAIELSFSTNGFNVTMGVTDPFVKAAIIHLYCERPGFVSCEDLWKAAVSLTGTKSPPRRDDPKHGIRALIDSLVVPFSKGVLDICITPPKFVTEISKYPKISEMAQWQVARSSSVISQLHSTHQLDPITTHILRRLDGHHDRGQLAQSISLGVKLGQFSLNRDNEEIRDMPDSELYAKIVDDCLEHAAHSGLLVEA